MVDEADRDRDVKLVVFVKMMYADDDDVRGSRRVVVSCRLMSKTDVDG